MEGSVNYRFDEDQKAEIQAGVDAGIDVSCYAKPEFLAIQMRQIRLGIQDGLDVEIYAKTEYDWFQMEEIRKGMLRGVDYTLYARPEVDYRRMRQIRKGLQKGINLSSFIRLEPGILRELRKSIADKISLIDYIKEGYNVEQLEQIRYALCKKIDIRPYICKEFLGVSIREIVLGLEEKLPVSIYASMDYGWQQMREIRLGMEARLDVSAYCDPLFSWQQMREIRLGLEEGIDVSAYRKFLYTAQDMERIRKKILLAETEQIISESKKEISDDIVSVFLSTDEMEACIEVLCDNNTKLEVRDIVEKLKKNGITQGLLIKEIEQLVNEKKYYQTIVVAKGQHPKEGENGWYEFFFNTKPNRSPQILPDGSADFRSINWYEMVEEGQKVALYHPAGFGVAGYTVTGNFIKAKKGREKNVLVGSGFELLEDGKTYVSSLKGKIDLYEEHRLDITRVIVLEDVSLSTGDVHFDGSVYVKGNVGSGVTIYATESVVVEGFAESATIRCGGDILLRRGANGGGTGRIEAKGSVFGQFFESIRVVAGEDISACYCLNCELYAKNMIHLHGSKGMLAGGYARAARGIKAYNVGNKARIATTLNVGIDEKTISDMHQLEGRIESVNRELTILSHSREDFRKKYSAETRNTMDIYLKIENAIYTKQLQLAKLTMAKDRMENTISEVAGAKVVVGGVLYEGTEIVIDNIVMKMFTIKDVTVRCVNKELVVESN